MALIHNEVKFDPKEIQEIIKSTERETARKVLQMIKQENGMIPNWIIEKVANRFDFTNI